MEILLSIIVAVLAGTGMFLILKTRTFPVVIGLTLLTYAVNLFLFSMGRLQTNMAPILTDGGAYIDPVPQALVLTAIVIGFGMTAFVIVLALRAQFELGSDHVEGEK